MNKSLDKSLLEEVALVKSGISEAFIEKDWFVTQVIKILVDNPYLDFSIVFTGGTALSKAHKLIERFSEDIDFRFVAPSLEGESLSKIRKKLSDFKKFVVRLLEKEFQIINVDARDYNRHFTIYLAYPTVCEPSEVLRPQIKLELTLSGLLLPAIELPVSSFVNEVAGQSPEIAGIPCIDPLENAADKLSAIAWRIPSRIRGEDDKEPDIVRHLHDLAKLSERAFSYPDFKQLAVQTIEQDADRGETLAGLSIHEKLQMMIRILESDPIYPDEYASFVNGMVYDQDTQTPSYTEAISRLSLLIEKLI
ncbi:nucleotidyl transferase AbiEii/AbiGii toxin family protein [Ravibacter arvi]|uniref:Nucleotidyl transferase AbiEii/AbiGii toxin family protein n=1 Tax=Ravibacter arvi TaxID=2051041 RepID=A0ABP8M4V5_9BACT